MARPVCDEALVARRGIQNALDGRHEAGDELHAGENVQVVSFQLFEFGRRVVHVCTPAQPSTLSGGCVAWNLFTGALVTAQYSPSTRRFGEPSSCWLAS